MNKKLAVVLAFTLTACTLQPVSNDLSFVPDEGVRMLYASNAGAKLDGDGNVLLLYEANGGDLHGQYIASSQDGLTFEDEGEQVVHEEAGAFRSKQLPDGMWISYGLDTTKGIEGSCLTSQSSEDGVTFTSDDGCRYELQEDDKGRMGVYEFFNDSKGNVVLLYIGDLEGMNNVRRAYSTDNGETFTFTNDNVLGDEDDGGGPNSYVDQKVTVLENGDIFLVAMKQGSIYGFISTDDGETFEPTGEEPILVPSDFPNMGYGEAGSLHDPQIIQLEDGRYRIYVTMLFTGEDAEDKTDDISALVSATSGN